jgi:hypothetical protein
MTIILELLAVLLLESFPQVLAAVLLLVAPAPPGAEVDRPILYAVYAEDIMARLMRIHADSARDGADGFLVVALRGGAPAYVRCRFADAGTAVHCETAPGTYPPRPDAPPPMSAATAAALEQVGYVREPANGRFVFAYEIETSPASGDWGGIAVAILDTLIDGFGARALSRIEIVAPLAPRRDQVAIDELRRSFAAGADGGAHEQ